MPGIRRRATPNGARPGDKEAIAEGVKNAARRASKLRLLLASTGARKGVAVLLEYRSTAALSLGGPLTRSA